ncbi:MAG: hypothetical protein M3Q42_00805 [Pseudomonadota bacterium]|nr:hypothetical protein [Pseudomonadota bacterium]
MLASSAYHAAERGHLRRGEEALPVKQTLQHETAVPGEDDAPKSWKVSLGNARNARPMT